MKVSSLLVVIIIGFLLLAKADDKVKVYNRTDVQTINASFRSCIRECIKSDSRDERTECTVQCTKKYRLPKSRKPIASSSSI